MSPVATQTVAPTGQVVVGTTPVVTDGTSGANSVRLPLESSATTDNEYVVLAARPVNVHEVAVVEVQLSAPFEERTV